MINKAFVLKSANFLPWESFKGVVFCVEQARFAPLFPQSGTTSIFYANSVELKGLQGSEPVTLKETFTNCG